MQNKYIIPLFIGYIISIVLIIAILFNQKDDKKEIKRLVRANEVWQFKYDIMEMNKNVWMERNTDTEMELQEQYGNVAYLEQITDSLINVIKHKK